MSSARIVITQSGVTGAPGVSRNDLSTGSQVTLSNANNSGIRSWRWSLVDRPAGSSAALSNPTSAVSFFTPDVEGSYLVELIVDEGREGQVDRSLCAVLEDFGGSDFRFPAAGETDEANWEISGSPNERGWMPDVNAILRQALTLAVASAAANTLSGVLDLGNETDSHDIILSTGDSLTGDALSIGSDGVVTLSTVNGVTVESHASRHERGGADELDGDHLDIDFTPSNYSPSTAPAEAAHVDDLAAHLAGIDAALAAAEELADGSTTSSTLRWDGAAWVENTNVQADTNGNLSLVDANPILTVGVGGGNSVVRIDADAAGSGRVEFLTDGTNTWHHRLFPSTGTIAMRRYDGGGIFQDDPFALQANGRADFVNDVFLNDVDPTLYVGDGAAASSSNIEMRRGSGGGSFLRFITGTSSATNDKRIRFDGARLYLESHDGGSYNPALEVDSSLRTTVRGDLVVDDGNQIFMGSAGDGASAYLEFDKDDAVNQTPIRFHNENVLRWGFHHRSDEDWWLARYNGSGVFQDSFVALAAGGHTFPGSIDLVSGNAAVRAGDTTGSPFFYSQKGSGGFGGLAMRVTTAGHSANDKRVVHNGSEELAMEHYNGSTWDTALLVDNSVDVNVYNDLTLDSASPSLNIGDTTGSVDINLHKAGTDVVRLSFLSDGLLDWRFADSTSENLVLNRYAAGVLQDSIQIWDNATGEVDFANDVVLQSANPTLYVGNGTGAPNVVLDSGAAGATNVFMREGGSDYWTIRKEAGDDLVFRRLNTTAENVLTLDEGNGTATFANTVALDNSTIFLQIGDATGTPGTHYFKADADDARWADVRSGGTATGDRVWLGRFAGTTHDFEILRYNTSGVLQDTPFAIDHGTGDVAIANDAIVSGDLDLDGDGIVTNCVGVRMVEESSASFTGALGGFWWVRNDSESKPMFQNNQDSDAVLGYAGEDWYWPLTVANVSRTSTYSTLAGDGSTTAAGHTAWASGTQALEFLGDPDITRCAVWECVLPDTYQGNGLTVDLWLTGDGDSSAAADFRVTIERQNAGFDVSGTSWGTEVACTGDTINGTVGVQVRATATLSSGAQIDSLAAGEAFRLRVRRISGDAYTGDVYMQRGAVYETRVHA